MRVKTVLVTTAIVSTILGAVITYLVLTVPNDLKADSLLKTAKQDLAAGNAEEARTSLSRIVQQFPRTDAAAAATLALIKLADEDRARLQREIENLRRATQQQTGQMSQLQRTVEEVKSAPPRTVVIEKPAPPPKKVPVKKRTPPKRRSRRR